MQPALFVGHGSPMNVIAQNAYTESLHRLGRDLSKPRAILAVSAHWQTAGTQILDLDSPPTIHDFFGFPCELYQIKYSAPGAPELVSHVERLLDGDVRRSKEWGFDHGTWAVLRHIFPQADIPVTQLSLNTQLDFDAHFALAARLKPLREDGVLILGSGNIVHNLREFHAREVSDVLPWAEEFDGKIARALKKRDLDVLVHFEGIDTPLVRRAVPTPEHYLPLLYVLGVSDAKEPMSFPHESIQHGSVAMRSVRFG
jgi:4,5-DOPA dioxygenase extradiol